MDGNPGDSFKLKPLQNQLIPWVDYDITDMIIIVRKKMTGIP